MIIEFIGAPGAGKTTLLPVATECLRARGVHAFTVVAGARPVARRTLPGRIAERWSPAALRNPLLWRVFLCGSLCYRAGFVLRHPRLFGHVVHSQRGRPAAALVRERRVLHWFFRLAGDYAFLRSHLRAEEALILDEGFVHRVVQLFASGVEAVNVAGVAAYLEQLPRPDLVIHIHAPAPVCEERIYGRGLWARWQGTERAEISRFVCNAHATVDHAVAHLTQRGWPVIHIDNSSPEPTFAQEALRKKMAAFQSADVPLSAREQTLSKLEAQP